MDRNQSPRYGSHVSHKGENLIDSMRSWHQHTKTCQLFLGTRCRYAIKPISDKHRHELFKYLRDIDGTIHIHAPYSINIANGQDFDPGPDANVNDKKNWSTYRNSVKSLTEILHYIQGLPMTTVIHIGAKGTSGGSIDKLILHIKMMQDAGRIHHGSGPIKQQLLLEVAAEEGRFGSSWEQLSQIFGPNGVDREYVGLCLDTAHLFGSGMCDFSSREEIDLLFAKCDSLGAKIGLIHLNDSSAPFNSKIDKHAGYGFGHIWKDKLDLLKYFIFCCFDRKIDIVSESHPILDMRLMDAVHRSYIGKGDLDLTKVLYENYLMLTTQGLTMEEDSCDL